MPAARKIFLTLQSRWDSFEWIQAELSSLPLSCVVVCSFLWFAAVTLEVGRMLNLWICPVCDLFLVQCSIESREALAPFLLQPPCWVCCEGNQQWCFCRMRTSSCALPLPASPSLSGEVCGFQILTGPEVGLELLRVIRAETVGMCPGANLQVCRDLLQFKA